MQPLHYTTRQIFPPLESPYEQNVGGQLPNQVFPDDASYPVAVGDPGFNLGTVFIELPGVADVFMQMDVPYPLRLQKSDLQEGIITGDVSEVPDSMPDYFWEAADFHRVQAEVNENRLLVLQYRDFAQKHPALKRPYRVAVVVEYIELHPEVEKITDPAIRARIYNDLINSDYNLMEVDLARYQTDADYSAADELRGKLASYFDSEGHFHPSVESYKVNNASTELY